MQYNKKNRRKISVDPDSSVFKTLVTINVSNMLNDG